MMPTAQITILMYLPTMGMSSSVGLSDRIRWPREPSYTNGVSAKARPRNTQVISGSMSRTFLLCESPMMNTRITPQNSAISGRRNQSLFTMGSDSPIAVASVIALDCCDISGLVVRRRSLDSVRIRREGLLYGLGQGVGQLHRLQPDVHAKHRQRGQDADFAQRQVGRQRR